MQGKIENICIRGMVSAVPCNEVCNKEYVQKIQNHRIQRQIKLTGIDKRRVTVGKQKASDLAAIAADELLKRLQWERDSVDVLIFVTQSPDLSRPSSAFLIQDRLGLGKQCMAYDINFGCAGYVTGLTTICSILQNTRGRGLLLVGESNAVEGDAADRNALLEGDAAAATALEFSPGASQIDFAHYGDGSRASLLYKPFNKPGYMDGNAVLLFGLSDVADSIKKFMEEREIGGEEVDYCVFHQAQKMIVDGIVQEAGIPENKVLMSCQNFGNTSSASIPLTLCTSLKEKHTKGKIRVLMCGYGIGLAWGIVLAEMERDSIFPLIETDYVYDDREKFGI